jgi:putative DNA primase/helicase
MSNLSAAQVDAQALGEALTGRKSGSTWVARCPAHDDRTPSLSITDGEDRVLVHCHAGCSQSEVIQALRKLGLWRNSGRNRRLPVQMRTCIKRQNVQDNKRTENALLLWQSARSATKTPVATYLRSRGIHISTPDTLRFHPALKHAEGGVWPAMLALVTRGKDQAPIAVHRTFLASDGRGKAQVATQKMMLGPCRGGVVRLAEPSSLLLIGEGIETCLAAMQGSGHPAWAALSTSGLRSLDLPKDIREVIVLADGDRAGEAAAKHCALRWTREGRNVRIARPPKGFDFNDLLMGRNMSNKGAEK